MKLQSLGLPPLLPFQGAEAAAAGGATPSAGRGHPAGSVGGGPAGPGQPLHRPQLPGGAAAGGSIGPGAMFGGRGAGGLMSQPRPPPPRPPAGSPNAAAAGASGLGRSKSFEVRCQHQCSSPLC